MTASRIPLVRLLALLAALGLGTTACAQASADVGSGFAASVDQLTREEKLPPPPPDWTVEIATAKPDIPSVEAFREPPEEVGVDDVPPDPSTLPGAQLTEIPADTPNASSAKILGGWSFANPTYFGNPLVFTVLENHGDWLKVMVPTRPNHQTGWIRTEQVDLGSSQWHAEINVTTNSLRVWNGEELVAETGVVDGRESSPTPLGRFYFNERIEKSPTSAYGSWILSTNGYSDSLEVFQDGLPVFAVHGTSNPSQIGSDISNGCVRVPNEIIEMMAAQMPMGSPVDVVA